MIQLVVLALASWSWDTGRHRCCDCDPANEMGCFAGVEASNQAAVELQVSFVLLLRVYSAQRCVAGTYVIRNKSEKLKA